MAAKKKPERIYRLEDIDAQFVSLVHAGANRQKEFLVVKAERCNACGAMVTLGPDGYARCEKCGNLVRKKSDDPELPVGTDAQQHEEDDSFDLSSFLTLAKEQAYVRSLDLQLQKSTATSSPEGGDADQGDAGEQVENQESPNLDEVLKQKEEAILSLRQELEQAKQDNARLLAKHEGTTRELVAIKSRYYALKTSVAGTTTFPRVAKSKSEAPKGETHLWTHDLAEQAKG